jgi:hypothetical protein
MLEVPVKPEAPVKPLNPRWLLTQLKERGLPLRTLEEIEIALNKLDHADREKLRAAVSKLTRGSESAAEMQWIADWVGNVPRAADEPMRPSHEFRAKAKPSAPEGRTPASAATAVREHPLEWSHHVYGARAAMCVEVTAVPGEQPGGRGSFKTVQLDFAASKGDGRFDWSRKLVFRLSKRELPIFAAVLTGWVQKVEFKGHGEDNKKSLTVEDQGGNLYFRIRQGNANLAVPCSAEDIVDLCSRALFAVSENAPGLDSLTISALVKRAGQMHATAQDVQSVGAAHG